MGKRQRTGQAGAVFCSIIPRRSYIIFARCVSIQIKDLWMKSKGLFNGSRDEVPCGELGQSPKVFQMGQGTKSLVGNWGKVPRSFKWVKGRNTPMYTAMKLLLSSDCIWCDAAAYGIWFVVWQRGKSNSQAVCR